MNHTMKKVTVVLVAMLFSTFASAAGKVVVFNVQAAIMSTDAVQKKLRALEATADFSKLKTDYEGLRADLAALDKDAQINGMTWNPQQKADFNRKVEYKRAELKLATEKLNAERNEALSQVFPEMLPKAEAALDSLVKAGGIDVVLDSRTALWVAKGHDITAEVTARLNKAK